jgi:hypothetical protein
MSMRLFLTLFLTTASSAVAAQSTNQWPEPTQPVYVVVPNSVVEGSGPVDTKFGDLLMVQIFPSLPPPTGADQREPIERKRLYQKGAVVPLFVDGERRGEVKIAAIKQHHCDSAAAVVIPTAADVPKKVTGLATNATGIQSRPRSRRDATDTERSSALQLATREFLRNKVAASLMTRINIKLLTAIEVDDSKEKTLVGSFFIQTKTERHDVFLIARANGSRVSLEYGQYRQTMDIEDFKDHVDVTLVDHLDLNHDGIDEIVLSTHGYEGEAYEIYARRLGKWELVATGGDAGC